MKYKSVDLTMASLEELVKVPNSHQQGYKSVFIEKNDTNSALTQFAYGYMDKGNESGVHMHKTMDEYFFIISGEGVLLLGEEHLRLSPSSFLRIPAGTNHNLINNNDQTLEFVYFGIAV